MGAATQILFLMLVFIAAQGVHSEERTDDIGELDDLTPENDDSLVDEEGELYRSKRRSWPIKGLFRRVRKRLWGPKVIKIWKSRIGHRRPCKRCDIGREDEVYTQCGAVRCVEDADCHAAQDKCTCPLGEVGDARVDCANPDSCCLCTIIGDPHFTNYFGANFRLPIPCAHKIVNLEIPGYRSSCSVVAVGLGWFLHTNSPTLADIEKTIHIKVTFGNLVFTVEFVGDNPPSAELLKSSVPVGVAHYESNGVFFDLTPDDAGFFVFRVKPCHVRVKFRPNPCSFSILTPGRSKDKCGMCGECSERWINATGPDAPDLLKMTMDNLFPFSPIDGSDINTYPSCTELYHKHRSCPIHRRELAQEFCGLMLEVEVVRECMAAKIGDPGILVKFKHCYIDVCAGSVQICQHADFFVGCLPDSEVAVFKAKPGFCH